MAVLCFFVPGSSQPKQRPRRVRNTWTGKMITYTPRETLSYESKVKTYALRQAALSGWRLGPKTEEYALTLDIRLADGKRKDLDNVAKACADALQPELIHDDWQISEWHMRRVIRSDEPGVYVILKRLEKETE